MSAEGGQMVRRDQLREMFRRAFDTTVYRPGLLGEKPAQATGSKIVIRLPPVTSPPPSPEIGEE